MSRRILGVVLTGLVFMTAVGCADSGMRVLSIRDDLPRHYLCHRTATPPAIDGKLEDAAWAAAPWTDPFEDIEADVKPKPRFETRAKLLWDDEYLYIAANLVEPQVWGTLQKHDDIVFHDNDFELFIDPDGDTREYYEIEINALNTIFDLFMVRTYIEGGPALHGWDMKGMKHAVFVHGTLNDPTDSDEGWSVEFALPWEWLKEAAHRPSPPQVGDQWRINFSRVEWQVEVVDGQYRKLPGKREGNWVWSPQGVINMHKPEYWGFVEFTE